MNKRTLPLRTGTLLTGVIGILFIAASVLTIVLVNYNMRQQALIEAEEKMRLILDRNMAVHSYFSQILKPNLFAWSEPFRPAGYFDPSWMSSTYAVREMGNFFKELSTADYYYKDAVVNARSPENEADAEERAFLEELKMDLSLQERSSVRTLDGKPYLVVLRPGEVLEESCLLCHGDPQDAPTDLVRQYGAERSFQREAELGNVISVLSVRVPLAVAYEEADRVSLQLSMLLLALMGLLFAVQFWLSKRLIFTPLAVLREKALEISTDERHLGEQIPTPTGAELGVLARAFNRMSVKLREDRDHLEARVQERTADLERSEETLRQEKDFAESLTETAQMIVLVLDTQGRILHLNRYMEEVSGYALAEVQGKDWFTTFLPERDRERTRTLFLSAMGGIQTHGNVNPIMTKDGRKREIEWYDKTLKDGQGNVTGLLSTGQDVTERKGQETQLLATKAKTDQMLEEANQNRRTLLSVVEDQRQAEQALVASEVELRALFASMQDVVLVIDREGVYRKIAPTNPALLVKPPEELLGKNLRDVFSAEQAEFFIETTRQVLETRQTTQIEYDLPIGGQSVGFSTTISPMDEVRTLWVAHDITLRRKNEATLAQSHEQLRALSAYWQNTIEAERAHIAREIHDEFGQSMTALKMDLTWLTRHLPEGDEKVERIKGMNLLVDDSINLMRRIATDLRPNLLDDLGLNAALEWQAREFSRRSDIPCKLSLPPDELDLDPGLRTTLFRIFQECLTNVARHSQATQVDASLRQEGLGVILSVHDNGRGISDGSLEGKHSLGLLGMRERAAQWDGSLTLLGIPGEGTTVSVRIPLPVPPVKGGDQ